MCLIAYSPKATAIPDDILNYANAQNNDGIGIMSKSTIAKFLGRKMLKRAKRHLAKLVEDSEPFAIHFRWATHGDVKLINTHPYKTPEGFHYVMHNGIITTGGCTTESSADESDTAVYVRKFMQEMPDFEDKQFYETMEKHIGYGNKFCIMDSDGRFQLCNEDAGNWQGGVWYSNTYSLPAARVVYDTSGWTGGHGGYYRTGRNAHMSDHNHFNDSEWQTYGGEGAKTYMEAVAMGFSWDYKEKRWFKTASYKSKQLTVIELGNSGNKDFPKKEPPVSLIDYYAALEAGMNEDEAAEYADTGHFPKSKSLSEALEEEYETGELAALRAQQGKITEEASEPLTQEQIYGGGYDDADMEDPDDRNSFRKYLHEVARNMHVK